MECPNCGYEKRSMSYEVDEVIRFKSGKRKGEIKEVRKKTIEPFKHDPEFKEVFLRKDVDEFVVRANEFFRDYEKLDIYMCPRCSVIFGKEW